MYLDWLFQTNKKKEEKNDFRPEILSKRFKSECHQFGNDGEEDATRY